MTIKKRFLISYIGGILIAWLSVFAIICVVLYVTTGTIPTPKALYRTLTQQRSLSKEEEEAYLSFRNIAKTDPTELIQSNPKRNELLQKFEEQSLGIVIRREQTILYYSKDLVEKSLKVHFPVFDKDNLETRGIIDNAGRMYRYVKFDFYFDDLAPGSILVLKKESNFFEFMTKWGTAVIVVILLISGLGLFFLNYLQKKTIIIPLENLGEGMEQIREGKLADFTLDKNNKNVLEVRQLIEAFEKMQKGLVDAKKEQMKLEENRKELVANISHDLKTPITSIIGYVEGLIDGVADTTEKQQKYLKIIQTKSLSLDYLVEELFLYSKLDAEALKFQFETINLNNFLIHLVEESQVGNPDVQFNLLLNQMPAVYTLADPMHLNRVFNNLIENSINHGKIKEVLSIEITIAEADEWLIIQVTDNGQGIAEAELPLVFDRFYRVEKSRTTMTGGSGLGLPIVKQIIERHGGKVSIESTLNVGTTVTILLLKCEGEAL